MASLSVVDGSVSPVTVRLLSGMVFLLLPDQGPVAWIDSDAF